MLLTLESLQARQAGMKTKFHWGPMQAADHSHMGHQPSVFVELADANLVVEGRQLIVHSAIVAANSKVFAEIFGEANGKQQDFSHQLEVPLPGDTFRDVHTALEYLYKRCTVCLASELEISGFTDAISLAKFAHKYEIEPIVQACEAYLTQRLKGSDNNKIPSNNVDAMAQIIDLAETCNMRILLAHCELSMIKVEDSNLWTHPAMLSNAVSRHSLLRMLRAFQEGLHQPIFNTRQFQSRAYDIAVAKLMIWNKS